MTLRSLRIQLVAKGFSWEDIKSLSVQDLSELSLARKVTYIDSPEAFVEAAMKSLLEKKAAHKVVSIAGAWDLINRLANTGWKFDELSEGEEGTVAEVLETIVSKRIAKLGERQSKLENRASNRALYLPTPVVTISAALKTGKIRASFDTRLQSAGLLPRILDSMGIKSDGPICLQIVNELPLVFDQDDISKAKGQEQIPEQVWGNLREVGFLPTNGNLAWNWRIQTVRQFLLAAFPKVIEMGAYNHRLAAPLLPGGFMEGVSVRFSNPMALDYAQSGPEIAEAMLAEIKGETLWFERDQGCDGSGLYDPDHELMSDLVAKYGKVPFQITLLRPDGLFAKGIVVPREGLEGEAIHLDMDQVKGSWKGKVAEGQIESNCYVGFLKAWDKQAYYPGNFELLQFVRMGTGDQRKEIEAIAKSLVEEALQGIVKDGIDGLMAEIAKDDEQLALLVKIVAQIRAYGHNLNPMSVPMIKKAINDKLRAKLWVIAQGAGIKGKQYVTVIDNSLPVGSAVISGYKIGSKIGVWRFPCVLPQGLVEAEVMEPRPHHLIGGKIVPNTIFMNSREIVVSMQGDDDGDIVGVTSDPRVLGLFKYRASPKRYLIEPIGEKFDLATNSPEGFKYLETDPRGPVGRSTILQAKLAAVGDWWGALAAGVLNQEFIDCAKRRVKWTDVAKACEPGNWSQNAQGHWQLDKSAKLDKSHYGPGDGASSAPVDYMQAWGKERLNKFGCNQNAKIKMQPLAWRIQKEITDQGATIDLSKRVNASWWDLCETKSGGWMGGNLVHLTHDIGARWWKSKKSEWETMLGEPAMIPLRELLIKLFAEKGIHVSLTANSWQEYLVLRKKAGIEAFGASWKSLHASNADDEDSRFQRIADIGKEFQSTVKQLSLAEQVTIWYWELTDTWAIPQHKAAPIFTHEKQEKLFQKNNPNYAFRTISVPGSMVLKALGIDDAPGCDYLLVKNRLPMIVEDVLKSETPFQDLSHRAFRNTKHGDEKSVEGTRTEFHKCQHCMDLILTETVREWRKRRSSKENEFMRNLVSSFNQMENGYSQQENHEYMGEWNEYIVGE